MKNRGFRRILLCRMGLACLGLATLFGSVPASEAQSRRPDTRKMTCAQARDYVQKHGQAIMTTGETTYETFVANASYCPRPSSMLRARFAPTKDNAECSVGYRCHQNRNNR